MLQTIYLKISASSSAPVHWTCKYLVMRFLQKWSSARRWSESEIRSLSFCSLLKHIVSRVEDVFYSPKYLNWFDNMLSYYFYCSVSWKWPQLNLVYLPINLFGFCIAHASAHPLNNDETCRQIWCPKYESANDTTSALFINKHEYKSEEHLHLNTAITNIWRFWDNWKFMFGTF